MFDLADSLGMTVASLRLGRQVPLSMLELSMWRARDRALAVLDEQDANRVKVREAAKARRERRRGRR